MINLSLISRFFDNRNEGIGNYSNILFQGLSRKKNINITKISQDNSFFKGKGIFDYFYFFSLELPFLLPDSDIFHALSPIESIRVDKSKTIVTVHDLMPIKIPELIPRNKTLLKSFFKLAMRSAVKCEEIITISKESANDISKFYSIDLEDISIIRQGINVNLHHKERENETYNIGTVSNLNHRKRIDILIKAFLKADIKNSKLFIGGKGPHLKYLVNLANDDERIFFLGYIPSDKMNDFYNSLDVFLFPSFMEGYGLPMVEAMACCKPVVTLEDAFIPEDVKKRTHVTNKSNLAEVLKTRDFNCDIESNLKFAKEHSVEIMASNMMKIYKNMV